MALAGFVLGFLIPAYGAGKRMADGFDFGNEVQSLTTFAITILLSAFAGGLIGFVAGAICGWVWEQVHKVTRKPVDATTSQTSFASGASAGLSREESAARSSAAAARLSDYRFDNSGFDAAEFMHLMQRSMPGEYDVTRIIHALERTENIGAWDGDRLIGAVRVLSDGYLFATIPEIVVDPDYRRRGIGRELMLRALDRAPTGVILFGSPPNSAGFFERLGCQRAPAGYVLRRKVAPSVQTR